MMDLNCERQSRDALVRELKAAGGQVRGNTVVCPFHPDRRPSAGIFEKDGIWRFKCQATECGFGGDVFDVRARAQGKPLAEVLLAAGAEVQSRRTPPAAKAPGKRNRTMPDVEAVRKALPGRIVSEHAYTNPATGRIDLIVFRIEDAGGKSYRPACFTNSGFVLQAPPKPWPLYRRETIATSDTVLVVEGEKCADALAPFGIAATTSPFGAGKAEHCDWTPLAGKNVVLWPDNDVPGRNHMKQVQEILQTLEPQPRVAWIEPKNLDLAEKEDVADLIAQLQVLERTVGEIETELRRIISQARPIGPLDKLHRRFEEIAQGSYRCVAWPWESLTTLTKALLPGTVTLLAGTVGASKSFMLMQAITHWLAEGEAVSIYALEGDKPFHLGRVLAQLGGCAEVTDPDWLAQNPGTVERLLADHSESLERLARCLWTSETLGAETLEQLAAWIAEQAKAGRRIICIDPVTAAVRTGQPWVSDLEFLRSIKKTATEYGCSILLVTHPQRGVTEPSRENLAGSAAYERFCETIITVANHEPKESLIRTDVGTGELEHNRTVRIEKARNGRGTGCRLAYKFDPETLTMREVGLIVKRKEGR
jgi:hypothetical protein